MTYEPANAQQRVAIVGSGASGLAAAFHLQRSGYDVELIERGDELGGRFGVGLLGDRPVMLGGKNIGRRYTAFRGFTASFGHQPWEPFGINASRVQGDQVLTLDSTRRGRSSRFLLRAGTPRDLARFASLAARVRRDEQNRFLGSPLAAALSRRHDHAPLAAHFEPKLTRNLLRPMTIRTNGAEPDECYLGTFNTNIGLLMDTYDQLSGGIQPVLDAFASRVTVTRGTRVESLLVRDGHVTGLRLARNGSAAAERSFDAVVLATPAHATADIVRASLPALSARLDAVRYFPSTVVLVEYDRPVFTPEVRALAMDDGPCTNAGSYGATDRHIVRYTFSGREARTPSPSDAQIDVWVDQAEARLSRHVPLDGAQRLRSVRRHWEAAYCAYVPFHGEFFADVRDTVAGVPGLELAGDYLRGVSIEACFRSGTAAGVRMASALGAAA
jgi:oxygen-dependent protoporphyrinogen oxidase